MTLIICVDDDMGMAFNRRRQSRDRAVCEDIIKRASGAPIIMNARSASLFDGLGGNISSGADNFDAASGCFCFVEFDPPSQLACQAEKLILYRWNRRYPADLYFDASLDGWRLLEALEFPGSSHEKITREVYIREN